MKTKKTQYRGIRIRGDKIQVDFRWHGTRVRVILNLRPTKKNLEYAFSKKIAAEEEIVKGVFNFYDHFPESGSKIPAQFGKSRNNRQKLGELIDWWFEQVQSEKAERTIKKYRMDIENHIRPYIGDLITINITPSVLKSQWREIIPTSNKIKNNCMSIIRQAFEAAVEEGLLPSNPAKSIAGLPLDDPDPEPLTCNEVDQFLAHLEGPELHYHQFAIFTGLRTGEQAALKWSDINLDQCAVYITKSYSSAKKKKVKTRMSRRKVELIEPAMEALMKLKELDLHEEYVFVNPRTGRPWESGSIAKSWNRTIKLINIKKRVAYQSRHTYATLMRNAGLDLSWLQKQFGHSKYALLENTYTKWQDEDFQVVKWLLDKTKGGRNGNYFTQHFIDRHTK